MNKINDLKQSTNVRFEAVPNVIISPDESQGYTEFSSVALSLKTLQAIKALQAKSLSENTKIFFLTCKSIL